MNGVLITFKSERSADAVAAPFHDYAIELQSVPGLVSKAWLTRGSTMGGFHVFHDEASARSYLGSALVAELTSTPGFTDFEVQHFGILDALSAMTGVHSSTTEVAR